MRTKGNLPRYHLDSPYLRRSHFCVIGQHRAVLMTLAGVLRQSHQTTSIGFAVEGFQPVAFLLYQLAAGLLFSA